MTYLGTTGRHSPVIGNFDNRIILATVLLSEIAPGNSRLEFTFVDTGEVVQAGPRVGFTEHFDQWSEANVEAGAFSLAATARYIMSTASKTRMSLISEDLGECG